ncbi:hypothetical protein CRUP_025073 [Coryphaenoides rupestris]|nr:hypothetical protein CRUP_025073 [Coryphaenoides rupestris]
MSLSPEEARELKRTIQHHLVKVNYLILYQHHLVKVNYLILYQHHLVKVNYLILYQHHLVKVNYLILYQHHLVKHHLVKVNYLILYQHHLVKALQRRGIIEDVMRDMQLTQPDMERHREREVPLKSASHVADKDRLKMNRMDMDPTRRYLHLQVLGGKAFLEHLQDPEPLPGQVCSTFRLYLHFRNQRFRSKPVPCACEPDLQEGFLLEVHRDGGGEGSRMADCTTMLSICDPVHLVLIKTDTSSETTLVSSYFLDWRTVLGAPSVLTISLELFPPLTETLNADIITTQQSLERQRTAETERLFLVYAKQWWREFLEIRPSHQSKLVKIFAQDENGVNRPVCSYVRVLRAGRLLETPRQAARFVSLLEDQRAPLVGGGAKQEQWCSLLAFLCRGKGDCEDHATLLCSLLLGFGLDAYVCVGTRTRGGPHAWVLTRGTDGSITFWESLTGHRYLHQAVDPDAPPLAPQPRPSSPYRTIGCVFNHRSFLANCQPSDSVPLCVFDFQNPSRWKAMSEEALRSVCAPGSTTSLAPVPPLCPPSLEPATASNQLELEMRCLVSEHRKSLGAGRLRDEGAASASPAGHEEFQDAVRRANPSRWKAMSEEALRSVCAPGSTTSLAPVPPLCPPSLEPATASNQLELEMRCLVSEHRKDLDLVTVWDDHLSYLLSSALAAYETERCVGVSCGNEEFQDAVRRAVPDGHTFKGFPIHFLHRHARRAFATCLRSRFCEEIVSCRGDHVRLALRVRVYPYPENACAVWIMFACKYRSVL